jgi:hypothetical protein
MDTAGRIRSNCLCQFLIHLTYTYMTQINHSHAFSRRLVLLCCSLLVVGLSLLASLVQAQQYTISYQGTLNFDSAPVSDGKYQMTITLYSNPMGTEILWTDTYSTEIQKGTFNLLLGAGKPLPDVKTLDKQLWLGVSVDGAPELKPLTKLGSAPMALNVADEAITKEKLAPDVLLMMANNLIHQDPQNNSTNSGTFSMTNPEDGRWHWSEHGNGDFWIDPSVNPVLAQFNHDIAPPHVFLGTVSADDLEIHLNDQVQRTWDANGNFTSATPADLTRVMRFKRGSGNSPNIIGGFGSGSATGNNVSGAEGSSIGGGGKSGNANTISSDYGHIGGGFANVINSSSANSAILGGESNTVGSDHGAISGGTSNNLAGTHSAIVGGFNLKIGARSFGFSGQTSSTQTDLNTNTNFNSQVAVFNDVDLLIGNVNDVARKLKFFEPNTSASYTGTNFTSFKAAGQGANIEYTLPIANGVAGSLLFLSDNTGTMTWTTGGGTGQILTLVGSTPTWTTAPSLSLKWYAESAASPTLGTAPVATGFGAVSHGESAVATGSSSAIGGGKNNTVPATGNFGAIAGGENITVSGDHSAVSGGLGNTISEPLSAIGGGQANQIDDIFSFVGGGFTNIVHSTSSSVVGGEENQILVNSGASVIAGGTGNIVDEDAELSVIGGGIDNKIEDGDRNNILGGSDNHIFTNFNSSILGGSDNQIHGWGNSTIGGGTGNEIDGSGTSVIAGGSLQKIHNAGHFSFIGSGIRNDISGEGNVIGGGTDNLIAANPLTGIAIHNAIAGGKFNIIRGDVSFIGGGEGNEVDNNSSWNAIGSGKSNFIGDIAIGEGGTAINMSGILSGETNKISANWSAIAGGSTNTIVAGSVNSFIGSGETNVVKSTHNAITGGQSNVIEVGATHSIIGSGQGNIVKSIKSVIGGGENNLVNLNATFASIGGGSTNIVKGDFGVIAGGQTNTITPNMDWATISGGHNHTVSAEAATITGGEGLIAQSYAQTVVGYFNRADGSFVKGTPHSNPTSGKDRLFVVGNGDNLVSRSNAFEVSYNGHSIVAQTNGTGGAMLLGSGAPNSNGGPPAVGAANSAIAGATYRDNIVYAWADIEPNPGPVVLPNLENDPCDQDQNQVIVHAEFGIKRVKRIARGHYQIELALEDPISRTPTLFAQNIAQIINPSPTYDCPESYGINSPGQQVSVVGTIINDGWASGIATCPCACAIIETTRVTNNIFDVFVKCLSFAGSSCGNSCYPADRSFNIIVTGRPAPSPGGF